MEPLKELPLGFGMALFQNETALKCFESMTLEQQNNVIEQTHSVNSKQEMKAFVDSLPSMF